MYYISAYFYTHNLTRSDDSKYKFKYANFNAQPLLKKQNSNSCTKIA